MLINGVFGSIGGVWDVRKGDLLVNNAINFKFLGEEEKK